MRILPDWLMDRQVKIRESRQKTRRERGRERERERERR
jgi:hypothetical protein